MTNPTVRRRWLYRELSLSGAIVVMIAGAAVAAVNSYNASREQQRAAARALHDYAVFASYTYSRGALRYAHDREMKAYAGLNGFSPQSREQLPPETILMPPTQSCAPSHASGLASGFASSVTSGHPRERHRFRLDLPSRKLHVSLSGEGSGSLWQQLDRTGSAPAHPSTPMDALLATRLTDTLTTLANVPSVRRVGWGYAFLSYGAHGSDAISFMPLYASSGEMLAVYGYESCYGISDRADFGMLYREVQPLPPSLVSSLPRDSLLFLQIRSPNGALLYTAGTPSPSTPQSAVTVMPELANISFTVTIRPTLSSRLLIGNVTSWAAPRAFGLLLLTLVFGAFALVLFRREARFVQAREDFVTGVSHELRTPLQQILIFVQLLRLEKLHDAQERARSLAIIETEAQRLIGLVSNILDRARPELSDASTRAVDLHEVIRNSIALFNPLATTRNATITLSGEDVFITTNPEALHQVLTNLLDNAVKYGPPGQTVRISTTVSRENVTIYVDDEGPGIAPHDRERVWEPFVRLVQPGSTASGGVGIGLAIARTTVQRMSGTISIGDAPGTGARLILRLPRQGATR